MNRRAGIIAGLAAGIGLISKKATMANDNMTFTTQGIDTIKIAPSHVTFNLNSFLDYTFVLDGEKVVLTPAEVMAALRSK